MKLHKLILPLLLFILLGSVTISFAGAVPAENEGVPETIVLKTDFGLVSFDDPDEVTFISTRTVPLKVGQVYGWFIKVDSVKDTVKWREEFTLPVAPATWGDSSELSGQTVSKDKRVSVLERVVQKDDGVIYNIWEVASGDPKGRYIIRVTIDDELERVFEFDVQ